MTAVVHDLAARRVLRDLNQKTEIGQYLAITVQSYARRPNAELEDACIAFFVDDGGLDFGTMFTRKMVASVLRSRRGAHSITIARELVATPASKGHFRTVLMREGPTRIKRGHEIIPIASVSMAEARWEGPLLDIYNTARLSHQVHEQLLSAGLVFR